MQMTVSRFKSSRRGCSRFKSNRYTDPNKPYQPNDDYLSLTHWSDTWFDSWPYKVRETLNAHWRDTPITFLWLKNNKRDPSQRIKLVTLSPLSDFFRSQAPKRGKTGGICSGRFPTYAEIMQGIMSLSSAPSGQVTFLSIGLTCRRPNMGPKRESQVLCRAHITSAPFIHNFNSTGVA